MPHHRRFVTGLLVISALLMAGALPIAGQTDPPAQPSLHFEAQAVAVVDMPAGAEILVLAVSREPQGYFTRVVRHEEVLVADAAGEARLELDREVAIQSVWVVADLGSGGVTLATPGQFQLRHTDLKPDDLRPGPSGQRDRLLQSLERLELLLLRPGAGAWRLSLHDGGIADADGMDDGQLTAALADLEPVGAAPPAPESILPGDLVVAIDPATLELFTLTVPQ